MNSDQRQMDVFRMRIPTWAMCYLVNGDDSGLEPEDVKTVDEWVERTRRGGSIDVCCPDEGAEAYFTNSPAFGLPCVVEDCDVVVIKPLQRGEGNGN